MTDQQPTVRKEPSVVRAILKGIGMILVVLLARALDNYLVAAGLPLTAGPIMFLMGGICVYLYMKI